MTLRELTLSALLSLVPSHPNPEHLSDLATSIAGAVTAADELYGYLPHAGRGTSDEVLPLPFAGPDGPSLSALALTAIAFGESALDPAVADCRIVGSDHPSITSFQLLGPWARGPYSRAELCASSRLAAERALWVFSRHARAGHVRRWFDGYASGSGVANDAGRKRCALWERLARKAGFVNASCWMRRPRDRG